MKVCREQCAGLTDNAVPRTQLRLGRSALAHLPVRRQAPARAAATKSFTVALCHRACKNQAAKTSRGAEAASQEGAHAARHKHRRVHHRVDEVQRAGEHTEEADRQAERQI